MEIPFDAIITLLVFLIGLPALVVQFMAPEVRRVVFDKGNLIPPRLAWAMVFSVLLISISSLLTFKFDMPDPVNFSASQIWNFIWFPTFLVLFITVGLTTFWFQYTYGRRENVIKFLRDGAIRELLAQHGRLGTRPVGQLIEIGKQSEPGSDRELVLRALKDVAVITCDHPDYRGETLASLIDGVVGMLSTRPDAEDLLNYKTAVEILKTILKARISDKENESLRDQQHAVRALSALGQTVISQIKIRTGIDYILMGYEEALGLAVYRHPKMITDISQAFLEVGAAALVANQFLFAVAVMERLVVIAEDPPRAPDIKQNDSCIPFETASDMLGLIAHFWMAGESSREYIQGRLESVADCVGRPLPEKLLNARKHCLMTMEFDTANKLAQMAKDLKLKRKPRKKK